MSLLAAAAVRDITPPDPEAGNVLVGTALALANEY